MNQNKLFRLLCILMLAIMSLQQADVITNNSISQYNLLDRIHLIIPVAMARKTYLIKESLYHHGLLK